MLKDAMRPVLAPQRNPSKIEFEVSLKGKKGLGRLSVVGVVLLPLYRDWRYVFLPIWSRQTPPLCKMQKQLWELNTEHEEPESLTVGHHRNASK